MRKRVEGAGWRRMRASALGLLSLLAGWLPAALALPTTMVQGPVYRADGTTAAGTLLLSWPSFTASDGSAVAAGSLTIPIGAGGTFSVGLTPNEGALPAGTYYTAVYHLADGTVQKEYWVVPQSGPVAVGLIRASVVPAAVAQSWTNLASMQSTLLSSLQSSYLPLKGGSLSGSLLLSSDPAAPMQAATKAYVDAHAGANLPANAIPFQTGSGSVQPATSTNIVAPFHSVGLTTTTATQISTAFAGTAGASIAGKKPEIVDVPNSAWVDAGGPGPSKFASGGVQFGPSNAGSPDIMIFDTGITSYTWTLHHVTLAGTQSGGFQLYWRVNNPVTQAEYLQFNPDGSFTVYDASSSGQTTLANGSVGTARSGDISITAAGTALTINMFGTVVNATVPVGSSTLGYTYVGVNPNGSLGAANDWALTAQSMTVTYPQQVPVNVACNGYLKSDGSCDHVAQGKTNAIQLAGASGLNADSLFAIDPTTHTATLSGNLQLSTLTNLGTTTYDLNDTRFLGGLAAAVAGTSGYTPTQVMQNASDYGYCQAEMGLANGYGTFLLPQLPPVNLSQVRFASGQSLIGRQGGQFTILQHTGNVGAMLTQRNQGETLTCPDGHTVTFGGYMSLQFAYFAISGENAGPHDVGIWAPEAAEAWWIHDIGGAGNEFGAQGILDQGFYDVDEHLGYPDGQISGCSEFIRGNSPVSASYSNDCAAVEVTGTDNEVHYVYASDGASSILNGSMAADTCYPNCASIEVGGNNGRGSNLFAQLDDIGVLVSGAGPMNIEHLRIDSSMREAIYSTNGANITDVFMYDACNDSQLDAAYAAGTATGCSDITLAPGSQLSNVTPANTGQFHASNAQCVIFDTAQGDAGTPSTITNINYKGTPDNATANGLMVCVPTAANASQSTQIRWTQPTMGSPVHNTTATANINGVTNLAIQTATLTNVTHGLAGQIVKIQADPFAPGGTATIGVTGNIVTCSGQPLTVTTTTPTLFQWTNNSLLTQLGCMSTVQGSETLAFSATPTFSAAVRSSNMTLTGNVTSFTLPAGADGEEKTLILCQDATGGRTVAAPANVHGFMSVGSTASKCSAQHFTYYAAHAAWMADGPGVVNE